MSLFLLTKEFENYKKRVAFAIKDLKQSLSAEPTVTPTYPRKRLLAIRGNSTVVVEVGLVNSAYTAGTIVNSTSTNLFTSVNRITYPTAATAGSSGGVRITSPGVLRGSSLNMGGFVFVTSFGISALAATTRGFIGLYKLLGIVAEPSTLQDCFGIGFDTGDTAFSVYSNDASGTATKTSLGANFPCNTTQTDWYKLTISALPNATSISYKLERLNTGHVAEGTISTNLPTATTFINPNIWINNNTTAAVASIDVGQFEIDTPF